MLLTRDPVTFDLKARAGAGSRGRRVILVLMPVLLLTREELTFLDVRAVGGVEGDSAVSSRTRTLSGSSKEHSGRPARRSGVRRVSNDHACSWHGHTPPASGHGHRRPITPAIPFPTGPV
ncbi:hypothetical protein CUJ84_pRLN2000203 (plasmid) [Rhizobium leguminosarum]|uniref:Uncharacterized protein n=1 Tax=Rhizobium leguminosarum TaxID=384 RepID=A0A2K9ZEQ8_RHILE|nr:hypothetical protein CUJ84_pRLN2000203 [Rhizobium leguminosarum]